MNYKDKVFDMLGVEPDEEFYLKRRGEYLMILGAEKDEDNRLRFYLDKDLELYVVFNGWAEKGKNCHCHTLSDILLGVVEIAKIPKKKELTLEDFAAFSYAWACGCEWLAKNKDGCVHAFSEKPIKDFIAWLPTGKKTKVIRIEMPMEFLSWEDDEPYFMPELPEIDYCPACGRSKEDKKR